MEMIVFYNAGRLARVKGLPRVAPIKYDYPIVSQYSPFKTENVTLCEGCKKSWYEGFDGKYERGKRFS